MGFSIERVSIDLEFNNGRKFNLGLLIEKVMKVIGLYYLIEVYKVNGLGESLLLEY